MFFTQDDYKKIQQWLIKNSVKDTEFNEANIPFNGEETITIVQGNQNKKVFLKDLIAQVFNLGISDFVNITDKYDAPNINLEEAIRIIPSRARKEGQVITFLDREDHWHIYQFKGGLNQWNVLDTWEDLFDWENLIIDSILPDEEDLTKSPADKNGNSYLSLKNREYNPEDFSGLGRIILRKNIVEIEDPIYGKDKKNYLYQDMINKENTIYEIRYDFDLNGAEITIPEGCVLDFQGGSFKNGNVNGNNTILISNNTVIFDNINIIGTWDCYHITDKMFLYKEGNAENNTQILTNLFSLSSDNINNNITISRKYKYIPIYNSGLLVKSNTTVSGGGEIYAEPCGYNYAQLFRVNNAKNVIIENLKLVGDVQSHLGSTGEWNYGIYLRGSKNCIIRNCDISEFWGDGINIQKSEYMTDASANEVNYEYHCHNILIENCIIYKNRRNNISIEAAIDVVVNNCKITDAGTINGTSPMIGIDIEPIPNNNQIVKNVSIDNCYFDGNIGKDVSVPAAMTEGYLCINNCEMNSFTAWSFSSPLDICIENSKIKGEISENVHTAGNLIINNSFINPSMSISCNNLKVNNNSFKTFIVGGTSNGIITNIEASQISLQNQGDITINNSNFSQLYVHRSISGKYILKNCNITGESIIMFNGSVEVNNITFENCNLKNNGERNPFIGESAVYNNCIMKKCTIEVLYTEEIWLPFDNYIDCNISAPKIKLLKNKGKFENCTIVTDNPIKVQDVSNIDNTVYEFKNTYVYTVGKSLTKSSSIYSTYVAIYGGNISRREESNEEKLYFTANSIVYNDARFSKYHRYINYVRPSHSEENRYICLQMPKITKGSVNITKYPSPRWQPESFIENINVSIYGNSRKASIKVFGNTISVEDYKKITYPKLYMDDNYIYIVFLCINGLNADAIIKADIYSDTIIDTSEIDLARINKSVELLSIPTNIENIIKDNTSSLKTIPITEDISIQYGYSTDTNKPIWWTGEKWVDATGADI